NNLISWLLELAEGEERMTPALALRVLVANAVSIHTTSMSLTSALYDLAAYPDHILPMREEAERVVAAQGWTKAALGQMQKIDSFLRESMRLSTAPILLTRKVLVKEGFTFSDGTTIPYGSFISATSAAHYDSANYDHADTFDGFRFSRMREEHHGHVDRYTAFGHGHSACPGRNLSSAVFFAAKEIKAMLAHILINYDIKAETENRPPTFFLAGIPTPNLRGKIWIRKRQG
ncbi:cytochrome P450, partial [Mycena capillaripes]